jgi:alkylation response protein AidB-like acyl-CoA dehydrogenase
MTTETDEADLDAIRGEAARAIGEVASEAMLRAMLRSKGEHKAELWRICADLGWIGMSLPEEAGGLGMGLAERCVIAEEIGRFLGSAPFTASTCALSAVARFGSAALRASLLPAGASGEAILTLACFEAGEAAPGARGAARFADGKLSGTKVSVSAGAFAHHALVHASGAGGGEVVVAVDLRQPGVARTVLDTLDNSRGYADLAFDNVPAESLGGREVLDTVLDELALLTAFEQLGGAEACLFAARDYALQRRVFGQPIGAFQAIKHGLADLYVLVQIARGAALGALQAPAAEFRAAVAAARVAASEAYDVCAQEGMQMHGGIGVTWQAAQHLHYRRARCLALEWGPPPWWRDLLLSETLKLGEAA